MEYWFSLQLEFIFDIILVFSFMNPKIINFSFAVSSTTSNLKIPLLSRSEYIVNYNVIFSNFSGCVIFLDMAGSHLEGV